MNAPNVAAAWPWSGVPAVDAYHGVMSESVKAPLGSSAPEFVLPRSGGGTVTLSSYRGRPVVLAFLRGYA